MTQELLIKVFADGLMIPAILIGSYALLFMIPKGHRLESYKRILMAGLTAYLLAKIIGLVFQPSTMRPFEELGLAAGASFLNNPGFPSDHTLFLTAIACAVWFETRKEAISIVIVRLVVAVCIGRVMALVHTPLDVIGGVFIALLGSIWYIDNYKHTK